MPAIQPARLKQQASDLAARFSEPAAFVRELHNLLDLYTDHTHRKGQTGEPSPLISSYSTPPPVMRQVWLELTPLIKRYPDKVLPLCDALWAEPNYDLQLLAARLLGQVPVGSADLVIDHLRSWVDQGMEKRTMDVLFEIGLSSLQTDVPDKLLDLVSSWLVSPDQPTQQTGLRALRAMIDQSTAEYLPTLYRLITPFLRVAPPRLRPDILGVLDSMIHCSPSETAYLLRQNLSTPNNPDTAWIIRQLLDEFSEEAQIGLRQAMKENR